MPQPHLRTRSKKRLKVALPGGENRIHYKMKIAPAPSCPICSQPLAGIPHFSPVEIRKLNRTKRKVYRPYGGQICHKCLKDSLKQAARAV